MPREYRREGKPIDNGNHTRPNVNSFDRSLRYCDRSGRPAPAPRNLVRKDLGIEESFLLDDAPRKALELFDLANYFRHYISNVAPWYDLSDSQCCFSTEVPTIALDEPLLFFAVMALSAMVISQTAAPSARATAEYYHTRCIRCLINLDSEDVLIKKGVALAATCLLRSYEILSESRDPNRHLKGAFSLASQFQECLDRPPRGLLHSGFWNYLREDITFSLFGNCPLKIDLDPIPSLSNISSDHDHLNAISLVLGRIINAMIRSTAEDARNTWEVMWSYVKDWLSNLPAHFQSFSRAAVSSLSRLPTVHMLKAFHAASRHYSLVSLAVLTIYAPTTMQVDELALRASSMGFLVGTVTTREDLLEHIGLEICGIAFTSNEPAVLVNAFGPISYCAKYIRTEATQQEVVRHLTASRKATGWPIQQIILDLQRHWTAGSSVS
ncbi:hypothetical protein O1611_g7062 [Lasiodiplodia mahajangana]|uniref:Uncharacterized protein n=1 Tax=Lasiodiplodia mahajangana TaxID=1108764 RepID=A0ACC2JGD9_9PEZI|nr:hypothetical protein O1611_g7062 [Lasiodiplodia mahajangana]